MYGAQIRTQNYLVTTVKAKPFPESLSLILKSHPHLGTVSLLFMSIIIAELPHSMKIFHIFDIH